MRAIYMKAPIDLVFSRVPQDVYNNYAYIYGLKMNIGSFEMTNFNLLIAMIVFGLLFYILSVVKLSKSNL